MTSDLARRRSHPRTIDWLGTTALAMGGSNQSLLLIDDTGVGICAEHMPRIFEPGFTTRPGGQGGFGLHGSARSAERMAGSLRAFRDGHERGARFVLELPRRVSVPTHEPASAAS